MKERPLKILDCGILAIQEGRKTQTRRPVKKQPGSVMLDNDCPFGVLGDLLRVNAQLVLRVNRTWIERIQDISEADAMAEGDADQSWDGNGAYARGRFSYLWDSIYSAKGFGWRSNPYVWCCEFEMVEG